MSDITYINGSRELLPDCKPLWIKLNEHHINKASHFKDVFSRLTYEKRIAKFDDTSLLVNIDLVKNMSSGLSIGYCISTLNSDKIGEIDSLYIDSAYRGQFIGDELMKRALTWLDKNSAKSKVIAVAEGNENVLEFYKRFGFYKRRTVLKLI